eukprot:766869-Hanusia_phi.AAC.3
MIRRARTGTVPGTGRSETGSRLSRSEVHQIQVTDQSRIMAPNFQHYRGSRRPGGPGSRFAAGARAPLTEQWGPGTVTSTVEIMIMSLGPDL